ncbi:PREDICTED: signal recognition particle 19 kDa protein isoform X3 [Chinchilla lanigera]|uniref:signal recognition particle 19 kDa protein isoform X3 n=1 Tax=Chinchilla lanigera TaxID=34839 RepID=UPI0006963C9F|nr:PREDICTED: signal recognition particle 19 kDa protein isoform X3 [Chinchilla lanigera]
MACAAARTPADQDRLLKILQLQKFKTYAQQSDLMHLLRKIKCTLENGIVMFNTEAGSESSSSRRMAASAWDSSLHVSR